MLFVVIILYCGYISGGNVITLFLTDEGFLYAFFLLAVIRHFMCFMYVIWVINSQGFVP